MSKEKPILFNTEMVQAILEGRKTQTRRVVKNLNIKDHKAITEDGEEYIRYRLTDVNRNGYENEDFWYDGPIENIEHNNCILGYSPYSVGDILWVRETWQIQSMRNSDRKVKFLFKAEPNEDLKEVYVGPEKYLNLMLYSIKNGWQPSIHMPREAARIFLKVTNVRVERIENYERD